MDNKFTVYKVVLPIVITSLVVCLILFLFKDRVKKIKFNDAEIELSESKPTIIDEVESVDETKVIDKDEIVIDDTYERKPKETNIPTNKSKSRAIKEEYPSNIEIRGIVLNNGIPVSDVEIEITDIGNVKSKSDGTFILHKEVKKSINGKNLFINFTHPTLGSRSLNRTYYGESIRLYF